MLTGLKPPDDFATPVSLISIVNVIVVTLPLAVAEPVFMPVTVAFVSNHAASYVVSTALLRSVNVDPTGVILVKVGTVSIVAVFVSAHTPQATTDDAARITPAMPVDELPSISE
jgi:hypothetical protein